jgi:hypothetical protein
MILRTFNNTTLHGPGSYDLHFGFSYKFWSPFCQLSGLQNVQKYEMYSWEQLLIKHQIYFQ